MTELIAEVASLKEQVKSSHKRIDLLEERVKMVPKLETLLEITIDTNRNQTETLKEINTNLIKLNNNYDNLTHRIGAIEDDLTNSRKTSSININKLINDTVFKITPGLVLAWLVIQFGLK